MTKQVCPSVEPLTEEDARHLFAAGINKPVFEQGPKRFALRVGCDEKTIRRARDEKTTLRLDHVFNSLLADPNTLDPIARHFNKLLIDCVPEEARSMEMLVDMMRAAAELAERLKDRKLCVQDICALSDLFRPLVPQMAGIVHQADQIKGAA